MEEKTPMTLEEKVAKLEAELGLVKEASATGTPILPPKVLPYFLAAYGILAAVTAGLAASLGVNHTAVIVLGCITAALAPALGIASPGLRRALLLAVGVTLVAGTSACVHLKPGGEAKLIACGTDAMQSEVAGIMPAVASALQGTSVDWQGQLDDLVAKAGSAALCALAVLVANLEVGGGAGEPALASQPVLQSRLPTSVLLTRAYSYQAAHPYRSK